jgi:DNA polymerase
VLDFETYFDGDYTLAGKKSKGITAYIADPRFEFTGLGIQINDEDPRFFAGDRVVATIQRLKLAFGKALHNCTVVAKNNKFDVLILTEKFGIYPPYTIDVEDLSRYYDSRMSQKLKDLAKHFGLQPKGDTMQFKGLHWEDMSSEQRRAMREYCLGDIIDENALLKILLPMLHDPGTELDLGRHTLNLYLKPTLELDTEQAAQIARDMDTALSEDISKVAWVLKHRTKAKPNIPKILRTKKLFPQLLQQCLDDCGAGEQVPMKKGKNEMIPATAKEDVGFQLLLAHGDKKVRELCQAKAACSSWSLHQSKVNRMIIEAECSGGKLRIPLKYYGAHTGRWSGTGGWNPLNLGGKGRGNPIHPLIGQVRNMLVAPDGYKLVVADSRQIEARELAWTAHQTDLIEGFANGEDIYSNFASELFQAKVWNPSEEEKETPEGKKVSIMRGFGKDAILGCGYGMGTDTFFDRCRQNGSLRPLFDSGEYDRPFIDRLIKTYRSKYANVPAFWREMERCFRVVTKYPGQEAVYDISDHAQFTFTRSGSTTRLQLPSGRPLTYHHATVSPKQDRLKYIWGPLWGGTLTENVIQAMCRCLFGGWLLECERQGIPIVTHTYDELVGCVPEDEAEDRLQQMINIMRVGPEWATGLPLDAEGWIGKRYKK